MVKPCSVSILLIVSLLALLLITKTTTTSVVDYSEWFDAPIITSVGNNQSRPTSRFEFTADTTIAVNANNEAADPPFEAARPMMNRSDGKIHHPNTTNTTNKIIGGGGGAESQSSNATFKPSGEPFDFAACLLMKDDNVILPEWLAYHYQVLPLRRLIIGLDPFALTSPDKIVEEYRREGMDITIWQEDDYFFTGKGKFKRRVFSNDTHEVQHQGYLWRQLAFLTTCLQEFKQRKNIRWTLLVDTDEYLAYNHFDREAEEYKPEQCIKHFKDLAWCKDHELRESLLNGTHLRNRLPVIGEKSAARFIAEIEQENHPWLETSCFVVPRILIGPMESSTEELSIAHEAMDGLDAMSFHTLRYRKFHHKVTGRYPGKTLVDVSKFTGEGYVRNAHRIHVRKCIGYSHPDFSRGLLRVHHYSGSFKTFISHRGNDLEELRKKWESRVGWIPQGVVEDVQGWLKPFISNVGMERARYLTLGLRAWAVENDAKVFPDDLNMSSV